MALSPKDTEYLKATLKYLLHRLGGENPVARIMRKRRKPKPKNGLSEKDKLSRDKLVFISGTRGYDIPYKIPMGG